MCAQSKLAEPGSDDLCLRSLSCVLNLVSLKSILEDFIDKGPSTTCIILAAASCNPNLLTSQQSNISAQVSHLDSCDPTEGLSVGEHG